MVIACVSIQCVTHFVLSTINFLHVLESKTFSKHICFDKIIINIYSFEFQQVLTSKIDLKKQALFEHIWWLKKLIWNFLSWKTFVVHTKYLLEQMFSSNKTHLKEWVTPRMVQGCRGGSKGIIMTYPGI